MISARQNLPHFGFHCKTSARATFAEVSAILLAGLRQLLGAVRTIHSLRSRVSNNSSASKLIWLFKNQKGGILCIQSRISIEWRAESMIETKENVCVNPNENQNSCILQCSIYISIILNGKAKNSHCNVSAQCNFSFQET